MQSTQLTPRFPRTSVRQQYNIATSRIPHQVQPQQHVTTLSHNNESMPGDNQIVTNEDSLSSATIQNTRQPYLCQKSEPQANPVGQNPEVDRQRPLADDETRKRFLTFSKEQASSHVKSLKEELFNQQAQQTQQNNKSRHYNSSSAAAKALEQRSKKNPCDQKQQQLTKHDRYFISIRDLPNGHQLNQAAAYIDDKQHPVNITQEPSPNSSEQTQFNSSRPRPLERLSKLPQQQSQHTVRVFASPRNSVHQVKCFKTNPSLGGDEVIPKLLPVNVNNNNNASFRQQPVCEAFIMTGQSMMKLSSNENDQPTNSTNEEKTVAAIPKVVSASDARTHLATTEQRGRSVSLNKLNDSSIMIGTDPSRALANMGSDYLCNGSMTGGSGGDKNNSGDHTDSQREKEDDISLRRRAFIEGSSSSAASEGQQHSRELAALLWAQQQQTQTQRPMQQKTHRTGDREEEEAVRDQHELVKNVARESEANKNPHGQMHSEPDKQQQQQQQQQQKQQQCSAQSVHDEKSIVINNKSDQDQQIQTPILDSQNCSRRDSSMELNKRTDDWMDGEQTSSNNNAQAQAVLQYGGSPPKGPSDQADRESARRLAKRLYNLSSFKRSDVCHHLAKNNPFSQMVAEEYFRLFDFRGMKLDASLRKFLSKLQLNGETQERERVLSQFSLRFYQCNKEKFPTADAVQTLVCAIILLNTDLHGNHPDRISSKRGSSKRTRLSLGAWIDGLNSSLKAQCGNGQSANLAGQFVASSSPGGLATKNPDEMSVPANYTFPRHLLVDLYESIKKRPLKCGEDKCEMSSFELELEKIYGQQFAGSNNNRSNTLPTRRFVPGTNAPSSTMSANARRQMQQGLSRLNGLGDDSNAGDFSIEFKSGFLFRKRIYDSQGRPTPKGRRSWRRVYVILQDLRLIMRYNYERPSRQQDSNGDSRNSDNCKMNKKAQDQTRQQEKQLMTQDLKNTLRLHHSLAKRSASYTKREYVFHLRLADQSELLLQAPSECELALWVDTINFASACLSSPALPSAVSNSKRYQLRQQRPILPTSYTRLSYWEQLIDHEERLQRFRVELEEHINEAPQTKKADKRAKSEFIKKIA